MRWADVRKIMDGVMPRAVAAPQRKVELTDYTKESLKCLDRHFENTSEMEAVLRVAIIVIQAVSGLGVKVSLQPAIECHPTFTDFYFVIEEGEVPLAFIEVKNSGKAVHLGAHTPEVAQTLREAHIIMAKLESWTPIPFILTNSFTWSFGLAEKKTQCKIGIKERFFISADVENTSSSEIEQVMHAVQAIVKGEWPLARATSIPEQSSTSGSAEPP